MRSVDTHDLQEHGQGVRRVVSNRGQIGMTNFQFWPVTSLAQITITLISDIEQQGFSAADITVTALWGWNERRHVATSTRTSPATVDSGWGNV
jgi:hypothetical protein